MSTMISWWVLAAAIMAAEAAAQDTSCLADLVPCLDYVSKDIPPPRNCCAAIDTVMRMSFHCLCHVVIDGSLVDPQIVNVSAAMTLPSRCGLKVNAAACFGDTENGSSGGFSLSWVLMIIKMMVLMMITIIQMY